MEVIRTIPLTIANTRFPNNSNWGDIDFALQGSGATLTASSTAAGYSINNVVNPANRVGDITVPSTCWKANSTGASSVTVTFPTPRLIAAVEIVFPQDSSNSNKPLEYNQESLFQTEGCISGQFVFNLTGGGTQNQYFNFNTFGIVQGLCRNEVLIDSVVINLNSHFANKPASLVRISCYGPALPYQAAVAYSKGDLVSFQEFEYQSLQSGNVGKIPNLSSSALFWIASRPSNKTSLVDNKLSTPFRAVGAINGFIDLDGQLAGVNRVVALNVKGASFGLSIDRVTNTYNKTTGAWVSLSTVPAFSGVFYSVTVLPQSFVVQVPTLTGGGVTEDATFRYVSKFVLNFAVNNGSPYPRNTSVEIGNLFVGIAEDLGLTTYGANGGITSYSVKTTDSYGNTSVTKRDNAKKLSVKTEVKNADYNRVFTTLQNLDSVPCVWVATDDSNYTSSNIIYGFYKDFSTTIAYPTYSICDLQIEGLT